MPNGCTAVSTPMETAQGTPQCERPKTVVLCADAMSGRTEGHDTMNPCYAHPDNESVAWAMTDTNEFNTRVCEELCIPAIKAGHCGQGTIIRDNGKRTTVTRLDNGYWQLQIQI
jgi:hypothetical protein